MSEREDASVISLPELEVRCGSCAGRGRRGRDNERCVLCDGSGYELTEFGERVLRLMRHHFRALHERMVSGE